MIVAFTVSIVCLYFASRGVEWADVGMALRRANPGWVAALAGASVAALYIRAQRWRILLRFLGNVPLYPVVSATFIGFGASAVLPLRLGEIVRPAMLGRRLHVGLSAPLSSIVLERFLDILFLIGCGLIVGLFYPVPDELRASALGMGAAAAVAVVLFALMLRHQERAERIMKAILARFPRSIEVRARPVFRGLMNGLADGRTIAVVLLYSILLWAVIAFTFTCGILALDLPVHGELLGASLCTLVTVALAVFLPNAPGYIGTWHLGCKLALHRVFGVDENAAIAFAWLTWVVNMTVTVGGFGIFLARENMSFGELLRMAGRDAPPADAPPA